MDGLPPGGWIGRRLPRAEGRRLAAWRGRYVDDLPARSELHAAFLRSPHPHAAFRFTDLPREAPGIAAVLTASELEGVCRGWSCPTPAWSRRSSTSWCAVRTKALQAWAEITGVAALA